MTESEMMADLAAADAAGDTKLAQHIAGRIKAARGQPKVNPWGDQPVSAGGFDPDAYLAKSAGGFDPDAYLANEWGDLPAAAGPRMMASHAPPASRRDIGSRLLNKLGEGMAPGFNRLTAAAQAATDPLLGRTGEWGPDFGGRFSEHLRALQGESSQTQAEHPWVSAGIQTVGALPSAAAMGTPASGLPAMLKTGATAGGAYGVGDTHATDAGGMLKDTALGAATGAAASLVPSAMMGAENALRSAARLLPRVTPTASARLLAQEGVPLTVGQMAGPNTAIGQFESVSANGPLGMAGQRGAAEQSFMRVAQNKGVAPGAKPPESTDLQGRLGEILKGFKPAYDKVRAQPIDPEAVASLPSAASMPGRGVDARTSAGVKAEIENALTILGIKPSGGGHAHGHGAQPEAPKGIVDQYGAPMPPPPKAPPKATAGDLLKVRENIRENIRAARQSQDFDRLRLLEGAEDVVTGAIDSNLSPELQAHLRETDRQYARAMTAANAAPSGQTTFTPLQYLKQVEKGAGRRSFKTGGAGELQDLGEAARDVFVNAPMTGYRGAVLNSIPFGHKLVGPLAAWANTPGGRAVLLRTGSPTLPMPSSLSPATASTIPPAVQALIDAMRRANRTDDEK